jgi:hypothetical protein
MPAPKASGGSRGSGGRRKSTTSRPGSRRAAADGLAGLAELLADRILRQFDAVLLTRSRIQETLDDATARGRITRSDANEIVTELYNRGRQQTHDLLGDLEGLLDKGRSQLGTATRRARRVEPVERIIRGADRARRTVGVATGLPVAGYDDLTAGQVTERLDGLSPAELRRVREYERRHANRKSVLAAIERALG